MNGSANNDFHSFIEGNGGVMEEVPDPGGRIRRGSYLPDSFTIGVNCKDCILSSFIQPRAHTSAQNALSQLNVLQMF